MLGVPPQPMVNTKAVKRRAVRRLVRVIEGSEVRITKGLYKGREPFAIREDIGELRSPGQPTTPRTLFAGPRWGRLSPPKQSVLLQRKATSGP